ncbi:cytochrome C assembly family protein [Occallatibacter riparius]|uniref:Cytochrome c biogenesis protein n=1 Tax=Occallatibacter riparius TaxID=1002689 RepID=A0A9J7BMK0_9BACT|nr:cytochrome c biogenesis protein [Occallatibacter riparius]UWZ82421.1 cytochrome c biogenesis protein [Occallatibacter riparius]
MVLLWLRVAAILYAGASIAIFPAVLHNRERWKSVAVHLGGLAFFFHFVSVVEMLALAHRWVPAGVRETESLLGLVVAGLFFLMWWLYKAMSLGIFALPVTFFIVFVPALGVEKYVFPSYGVRMSWLVAHVVALMAAYAALGFSIVASGMYLLQERRIKSKVKPGSTNGQTSVEWLPPLDTLERIAHATLLFGFPCMTVGLVIGSVLVQETDLGAAYFRDPKILASFIMWASYVLLLFWRSRAGLRGRKAAYLSGAVFLVMLAVWAANQFSQVHRFGAP